MAATPKIELSINEKKHPELSSKFVHTQNLTKIVSRVWDIEHCTYNTRQTDIIPKITFLDSAKKQ